MSLYTLLDSYRKTSKSEREKGTYFELLCQAFLSNDTRFTSQFEKVLTYAEWAAQQQGLEKKDLGIDLVASVRDETGYCAIQCKFYAKDHSIQKSDINSFFTELGKAHFIQGLIIDSTIEPWSNNAESALTGQSKPVNRIGLQDLEASTIDWDSYQAKQPIVHKAKKQLRPHQAQALEKVQTGFQSTSRGKLIMACGTGKTFTSLKIAENIAGKGKQVLFLVPSLSLMSQAITDWVLETDMPIRAFAVCSDTHVGKRKNYTDEIDLTTHDLAYPATTNADKLVQKTAISTADEMVVIFATYQSIQVIADAHKHGLQNFDLVICDEAHRTTGTKLQNEESSNFIKVHDQNTIKAKKRLYMTATPRIYGDAVRSKAKEADAILCSMDDESIYGDTFYRLNFSEAVEQDLLTDYKVIVLAVNQDVVSTSIQELLSSTEGMKIDDVSKLIGCYRALTKLDLQNESDNKPMRRAVSFCRSIESSKFIKDHFTKVVDHYLKNTKPNNDISLNCEAEHIDGTDNASVKNAKLHWLKEETTSNTCRILSNARCLSEGVDVPALDAIMFLHPRKSMVDVVQSVGRVMRRSEGKKLGYVILPVAVPATKTPEKVLANNTSYQVVWQVLNALRSHDENLDATINKIDLGANASDKIETIGVGFPDDENDGEAINQPTQETFTFNFGELQSAIYAKLVKKCGTRTYWEDWSKDIADIAQAHISRIKGILKNQHTETSDVFDRFLKEIQDDLNDSINRDDAIEMLSQHLITKPVFDALFDEYQFAQNNPVSKAMENVLAVLSKHNFASETQKLNKFYQSVKTRAKGIDNIKGKQKIILELYDKFFRTAFKRTTEKLGIVYTPIEVVDFIIHSINHALQQEFSQTLGSKGVHIIDPFTGTGTFITRLLQSGLISKEQLAHKYKNEIHANEIVLLAYYIASINIEQVYHDRMNEHRPFTGICLTDTFQLYEKDDLISKLLADNSTRRKKQKAQDIRVIMGNPPYSAGQKSGNDNNQNVAYKSLDARIADTYAKHSSAINKNSLYDSYIRSIRWASDRIGSSGVLGFVTNASFLDSNTADGVRKCLAEEFSSLYIFHLRGNARTQGELRRQEKDNAFGQGTRTPIAITLLVKNPQASQTGEIYFHDIGDYLSREDKLAKIAAFKSIGGISQANGWRTITPDNNRDWLNQRDSGFDAFIPMGDKKDKTAKTLFANYSSGIKTNRDAWVYNASKSKLENNIKRTITFYNIDLEKYDASEARKKQPYNKKEAEKYIANHVTNNSREIAYSRDFRYDIFDNTKKEYLGEKITALYRPFSKTNLHYDAQVVMELYQMPKIFPEAGLDNRVICVTGLGGNKGFSVIISDTLIDLNSLDAGAQCFPLKIYEKQSTQNTPSLFDNQNTNDYLVKDGITDTGLKDFQTAYPQETISKEDVFYYVYGLLHSEQYRTKYKNNLTKQLPRIPCVKTAADFWAFSKAGRKLAELHINYEQVEPYQVEFNQDISQLTDADFRVTQMKFAKQRIDGKSQADKTSVVYNSKITMTDIPLQAYDYIVNGKPALEWVMERQSVMTHKDSGIVNDANDWAIETMHDARYPLDLFRRMISVSLRTLKIIDTLPNLDIAK